MTRSLAFFAILTVLLSACVPQQRYAELEQTLQYYKSEALAADSIKGANEQLVSENNQTQADMRLLTRRMEELTATNISLNRNYQDIVQRYNALAGENQEVLAATSYETTNLQRELAARQTALDQQERQLDQMEYTLREREQELRRFEARGGTPTGYDSQAGGDPRYQALQARKASIDQQLANLDNRLRQVLVGFPNTEVSITRENGKIVLGLSQSLLFPQSNDQVYWKGRQALQQIAVVLRENPSLGITVLGHTQPTNDTAYDWQLSTQRALAVTRDLLGYGVPSNQLHAAGAGAGDPAVPNSNPQAASLNSRTEIVLTPDYGPILESLNQ